MMRGGEDDFERILEVIGEEARRVYEEQKDRATEDKKEEFGVRYPITERDIWAMRQLAVLIEIEDDIEFTIAIIRTVMGARGITKGGARPPPGMQEVPGSPQWTGACVGEAVGTTGVGDPEASHCGFYDPNLIFHDVKQFLPPVIKPPH